MSRETTSAGGGYDLLEEDAMPGEPADGGKADVTMTHVVVICLVIAGAIGAEAYKRAASPAPDPPAARAAVAPTAHLAPPAPPAPAGVSLSAFSWKREGFGTVALARLKVKNENDYDAKDITIRCEVIAKSGTTLGRIALTVYDVVPAGTERAFSGQKLGLIDDQAHELSCLVVDFDRGSERE